MIRALVAAAIAAAALSSTAACSVVTSAGVIAAQPFQTWLDRSEMPTVPAVDVRLERCPQYGWPACADPTITTVYLDPSAYRGFSLRFVFLHETGHLFDRWTLTDADRHRFQRMVGSRRDWFAVGGAQEQFADAYAACSLGISDGPNYYPSARTHVRVCALIREAAATP